MAKFDNAAVKIKTIKTLLEREGRLTARDIAERLKQLGYKADEKSIAMFIYHKMLYKYVRKENHNGVNVYTLN